MTDVSEQTYGVICKYCVNCENKMCLKDVPWYCASINCKYFAEAGINAERIKPLKRRKISKAAIKRMIKKSLVETF